jgi:hypothetical protein
MPTKLVATFMRRKIGVDIEHILLMANRFEVSREAAARRYVLLHEEPAAVVFSRNGVIRYCIKHPDFPTLDVWGGIPLPTISKSKLNTDPIGSVSDWDTLDAGVWLKEPKGKKVCEQVLAQQNGFKTSLVTMEEYDLGDEDDEEWEPPTFRR